MRQRIGPVAATAVLFLGVVACGGSEDSTGSDPSVEETRTIETAKGAVDVPESPERVVVMDTGELDNTLALGVTPVGAVTTDVDTGFLDYLGEETEEIDKVGTITEPNLEKIAALEPDLILSSVVRHGKLYEQLSEIAPTVLTKTVGYPWKQNFQMHAEALGREQQAKQLMSDYQQQAAAIDKRLADGTTISLVRFLAGETRLYSDKSFSGVIISDVGGTVPGEARGADTYVDLSQEKLGVADADLVLTSTYGPPGDTDQAEITKSGLWTGLEAVRQGRVTEVNDDLITGIGITAAGMFLDTLGKAATG